MAFESELAGPAVAETLARGPRGAPRMAKGRRFGRLCVQAIERQEAACARPREGVPLPAEHRFPKQDCRPAAALPLPTAPVPGTGPHAVR